MVNQNKESAGAGNSLSKACEIQLKIASHILDVCNRYSLRVWADWGTLLGAVRERGFIPWDDDIDLMMMRDDYEKLIQLADTEFTSPFFLQSVHTEKQYFRGHAQVRYDGTSAILPDDVNQPFHQGIFVDIFVYDNIPDEKGRAWKRSLRKAGLARKCLQTAYYKGLRLSEPLTSVKFIIAKAVCLLFGPMSIYRIFERQFTKWNNTDCQCVACPTFDLKQIGRETKRKEWYSHTVMLPFENIELPAPANYHEVLTAVYGNDYMVPRRAPSGHGEMIVSADKSYKDVLAELKNKTRI